MKIKIQFRRICWLLSLLWPFAAQVHGQKLQWSPDIKGKKSELATSIVCASPGNMLITKAYTHPSLLADAQNNTLERLNADLSVSLRNRLVPAIGNRNLIVRFVLQHYGKIYGFCTLRDPKLDITTLYAQEVDPSSLKLLGNLRKIAESSFKGMRSGVFDYEYSRDSSYLMIYANSELRKNEPEKFGLHILGAELEEVWAKEVTLPYSESKFLVQDVALDNDGNAFILGINGFQRGLARGRGAPTYDYRILAYRQDGVEADEYIVSLGDMFLTDMKIDVSPKKDILCAGFYSERGTWSIKGSFFVRIDRKTKEIEKMSAKEFDLDFITMNFTKASENRARKRAANGKNVELYEYSLRDIVPRADGGAILLAEQYYVTTVCTTDPKTGFTRCTNYYHYNDVIVVSIDPQGDIEWATKVPKHQVSTNDGGYFSSFAQMVTDDALYLVKQGRLHNFTVNDRNGIVMLAKIDINGNVTRKALAANEEISVILVPRLCRQLNSRQLFLYGSRRKHSQYGLATF
jgi:hypothetical protein